MSQTYEPTRSIEKIAEEVQQTAKQTQSEAFRYEETPQGLVEIRCTPSGSPKYTLLGGDDEAAEE